MTEIGIRNGDTLPIEFMARREDWNSGISIYMRQRTAGEGSKYAATITMVQYDDACYPVIIDPMLRIEIQEAQQLMDELWQCGLRPTEGSGSAGSLAATERHLKDMQAVAYGLLRKIGVQV